MSNRRSQWIIRFCFTIAGLLWVQMALYGLIRIFNLQAKANLLHICSSWLLAWQFPILALVLDVLIWSTIAISAVLAGRQLLAYRKAKSKLRERCRDDLSRSIAMRYALSTRNVAIVEAQEPIALTMGFTRPLIVLSTGLLDLLDETELEAVIRHEQFHLNKLDSLRTMITYFMFRSLWYLPILKWCHHSFRISREVLADQYAVERTGSAIGLGSALLKLARLGSTSRFHFAHASFADTPINLRIQQLLDPERSEGLKPPLVPAMISLHVLAFLTSLLLPSFL